jgi:hypothetical protein
VRKARRFVGTVSIELPLFYGNALAAPEAGAAPNMEKLKPLGGE